MSASLHQGLQRCHMSFGKIHHMNIVTHARAIGCGVVATKDIDRLTPPHCHLGHKRHQIVRNICRVFTDQATVMCAHRIKVTQRGHLPARIQSHQRRQHLLAHQLGVPIRVGVTGGGIFCDRHHLWVAIDRAAAGEDQCATAHCIHGADKTQKPTDIVGVVLQRLFDRFPHGLKRCEMNDGINCMVS